MNKFVCNRPGCVSMVAYDGAAYCAVHGSELIKARQCDVCKGSGQLGASACSRCGGVGVLDKATHAPKAGLDRRREKVDDRGLIKAQEDVGRGTRQ